MSSLVLIYQPRHCVGRQAGVTTHRGSLKLSKKGILYMYVWHIGGWVDGSVGWVATYLPTYLPRSSFSLSLSLSLSLPIFPPFNIKI